MAALRRLVGDIHDIADTKENDKAIALMPLKPEQFESNYKDDQDYYGFELRGIIIAPPGSPIAGYILFLEVSIPPEYPFKPPKIRFVNKVWHPKVRQTTGSICLNILGLSWRPKITLETVLLTIQSLLADVGDDMNEVANLLNRDAADQYLENRSLYNSTALKYAKESNEGYGLASFYDYRMLAIQAILNIIQKSNTAADDKVYHYFYKMYVFCKRDSPVTCTLCITIVPNLYMYRQYVEKQYQNYSKITTSYLHAVTNKISVSYDGDGFTRDKCWKISPMSELTFTKDDIDRDPRKHQPITYELKLEWVWTTDDPERFLHQFSVINAESLNPIRSFDICIDPQPGGTEIATIRDKKYDERPTMPELIKFQSTPELKPFDITQAIGIKYKRFGIFLLEDETGSKVQAIKHQMKGESCSSISMEILRRWLEGEGKQPTIWATLIEVFYDCQLVKCANDIKNGVSKTTTATKVRVPQSQNYVDQPWWYNYCSIM